MRQAQAQPWLEALHEWLIKTRVSVADDSDTASAIDYSVKLWPALCRYASARHLPVGQFAQSLAKHLMIVGQHEA